MKVAVVSSCYGNYDRINTAPKQLGDFECEWVLVTDHDDVRTGDPPRSQSSFPWRVVVEPKPQLHPRLAAKLPKCRPDLYAEADVYIWIDASIQVTSATFIDWCIKRMGAAPLANHYCTDRDRITHEAVVAMGMGKYRDLPIEDQVNHYLQSGYPDDWGLWATGVMVRRSDCVDFGDAWLREQVRWTYEDQISFPYVLWQTGIRPIDLAINWKDPGRFIRKPHEREDK